MRRAVEKTLTRAEALSKAYSLSHPILAGDAESALRVVLESLNEWDVDWVAQKHRTYHKARPNRTPNKIILSRPALLQYIVCRQTTAYEIAQETAFLNGQGSLTERTLLLRYVKHLLHESASRSFYVAVGICRILHKYDHATTKRFYAVLDQRDQGLLVEGELDNKTDDEYRRWKMILIDKLEHRFKEFVSVARGPRNEKRFLPNDQSDAWSEYIRKCLVLLTPWETEHVLPPEFVPTEFNLTKLKCEGRRDEWDSAEENRMHTIIDPECFSRLAKACGAPTPEQQLDVPQLKSVGEGPGGGTDDQIGGTPDLTFAQAKSILDELDRRDTRRKVAVAEYLSVEVDGVERGRLDPAGGSGLRLDLNPESRQIQVFITDAEGKLLLASLWLSLIDIKPDVDWGSSIVLEGGQKLGIELKPSQNSAGEISEIIANISYKDSNLLRIFTQYYQRVRSRIFERLESGIALNPVHLVQKSVYNHRFGFAMLLLIATLTFALSGNSRLPIRGDGRSEGAGIVKGGQAGGPPPTHIKPNIGSTSIVAERQPEVRKSSQPHTEDHTQQSVGQSHEAPQDQEPSVAFRLGGRTVVDLGCWGCTATPIDPNLKPRTIDKVTTDIGFEYEIAGALTLGVRGLYHAQVPIIEDGSFDNTTFFLFNPRESLMNKSSETVVSERFERDRRYYRALEFTATKRFTNNYQFIASYVYSSLTGNYEGLFRNDSGHSDPNSTSLFDLVSILDNAYECPLNNKAHHLKFDSSYRTPSKAPVNASFRTQSGIPFNAAAPSPSGIYRNSKEALVPHRTTDPVTGRIQTPATYSLDLNAYYPIQGRENKHLHFRVDWFNVFNTQRAIMQDLPRSSHNGALIPASNIGQMNTVTPITTNLTDPGQKTLSRPDHVFSGSNPNIYRFGVRFEF